LNCEINPQIVNKQNEVKRAESARNTKKTRRAPGKAQTYQFQKLYGSIAGVSGKSELFTGFKRERENKPS
jgi:hypothetical protein